MDSVGTLLAGIFVTGAPCTKCGRKLPTYQDPGTSARLCLECLEAAVDEAAQEFAGERDEMARLAAMYQQIAA